MTGKTTTVKTAGGTLPRLVDYRGCHRGGRIVVCGCGASLAELEQPERFVTIGVNDVGRCFDPTYLVVLNPRSQFKGDRFRYVRTSRADALFTQLDLGVKHQRIVRFKLGERAGCDLSRRDHLPYTQNSPYVALCLALVMGAQRIGLIGVDFTDDHFFARSGRHPLSRRLRQIDHEYQRLADATAGRGVEIVNLSSRSRLTAFPQMSLTAFAAGEQAPGLPLNPANQKRVTRERETAMKIAVETRKGDLSGNLLKTLAATARELDHQIVGPPSGHHLRSDVLSIVWNGRRHRSPGPTLYCEHGWLPRWHYQISPAGINADSHIAPFRWPEATPPATVLEQARAHLESLCGGAGCRHEYMRTDREPPADLPRDFLLVPLQIEQDTNIVRHVPARLRRMQALIDQVSANDPPWPVLFKQHPADRRRANRHLRLRVRRQQDQVRPHDRGNIHQILKSGRCRGVISLNSNVVHDGLLWNVPAVVLGDNVWPREAKSPFYLGLPQDWGRFEAYFEDPEIRAGQLAYVHFLITHQWTLEDARNRDRVAELLESCRPRPAVARPAARTATSRPRPRPRSRPRLRPGRPGGPRPVVNVVARNHGWLFEDLKRHFTALAPSSVCVKATENPLRQAAAWIFLRTQEAARTPDARRTLVQIHDLWDDGLYRSGGKRRRVTECGGVTLTHRDQTRILEASGISLGRKRVIQRPLGASQRFRARSAPGREFVIGWVGRPVMHGGRDIKRTHWLVKALETLTGRAATPPAGREKIGVLLLGERLGEAHRQLQDLGIRCRYRRRAEYPFDTYPRHYRELDALVVTSESAAGPNSLYEALASGVPVVSTPVGWAPELIRDGENGYLARSPEEIATALEAIRGRRADWFDRRQAIRQSVDGLTLESWIEDNLAAAVKLAGGRAAGV